MTGTIRRVLVANRGEIAVRIVRACRAEGIEAIVTVSSADQESLAAQLATDVVHIGPASPSRSYLRVEQVIAAALLSDCDAVHPGYGFLSERPELAEACNDNGLIFIGPSADTIRRGGDKVEARRVAVEAGVPVGAGSAATRDAAAARSVARDIGFPILLKAAAGGGGRGMARVDRDDDLAASFATATREADAAFGDGRLYVERYVEHARHVEVQLLGDGFGNVVHLGDRDCSVQRRFQKLIEEAPASALSADLGGDIADAAVAIGRRLAYRGAGTVEFLVDLDRDEFSFLEINTRIQVEHPVTEAVTGVDIVREQLHIAGGEPIGFRQDEVTIEGHAIEFRINAESPAAGFTPSPGTITTWEPPIGDGVRLDSHCFEGYTVPPHYDSMIAKLIVLGEDRDESIDRAADALASFEIGGLETTCALHRTVLEHTDFRAGNVDTRWLEAIIVPGLDIRRESAHG